MSKIATSLQAYTHDYSGRVPPTEYENDQAARGSDYAHPRAFGDNTQVDEAVHYPGLWHGRLRRYIEPEVLICPLTTRLIKSGHFYRPVPKGADPDAALRCTTYGMNWRFFNGGELGGDPEHPADKYAGIVQTLDSPPVPKRTVLLIETQQQLTWEGSSPSPLPAGRKKGGNVTPYGDWDQWFWAIRWLDYPVIPFGHKGGCNIILADGHAAFINIPNTPYPPKVGQVELSGYTWW